MIDTPVAMLASTLLMTNVESHKRASSRGRLLMDSSASNPSLVQGLTRPTMDPTQIKSKETRGRVMFLQSSSVRVAKIPRWLRVVSRTPMDQSPETRRMLPSPGRITGAAHRQGSPGEARAHQAGYMPHLPASLCHVWAKSRASGRL